MTREIDLLEKKGKREKEKKNPHNIKGKCKEL